MVMEGIRLGSSMTGMFVYGSVAGDPVTTGSRRGDSLPCQRKTDSRAATAIMTAATSIFTMTVTERRFIL